MGGAAFGAAMNNMGPRGIKGGGGPWWFYLIVLIIQLTVIGIAVYVIFFDADFLEVIFNV